jgi:glutamate N-acetyltransferase/amino-acid N-acetyltransferase
MITKIDGGVCAPKGFRAAGVESGIKKGNVKDLLVIAPDDISVAAGVFTKNSIKSPSTKLTMNNVKNGYARAVVINTGNANMLVGEQSTTDAQEMASLTASLLNCDDFNVLVGSIGKPGLFLNMPNVRSGIRKSVNELSNKGSESAAEALMSSDSFSKEYAVEDEIQGERVKIGGIVTGTEADYPEQNSMIAVISTDVNISKSLLQKAIQDVTKITFDKIYRSEGANPTDMILILANGEAENPGIVSENFEYSTFVKALENVCLNLTKLIVKDTKPGSKLVELTVEGAANDVDAEEISNLIGNLIATKKVITQQYIDFARIISTIGNSKVGFSSELVDITIGDLVICRNSTINQFDMKELTTILSKFAVTLKINVKKGTVSNKIWTNTAV